MRVTSPEDIKKGEAALLDAITSNLDPQVIREIFKKVLSLDVGDDIRCKRAEMGVHEDEVAYSMDFEVTVGLSVLLDRAGNFISASGGGASVDDIPEEEEPDPVALTDVEPLALDEELPEWEKNLQAAADEDAAPFSGSYEEAVKEFATMNPDTGDKNP